MNWRRSFNAEKRIQTATIKQLEENEDEFQLNRAELANKLREENIRKRRMKEIQLGAEKF